MKHQGISYIRHIYDAHFTSHQAMVNYVINFIHHKVEKEKYVHTTYIWRSVTLIWGALEEHLLTYLLTYINRAKKKKRKTKKTSGEGLRCHDDDVSGLPLLLQYHRDVRVSLYDALDVSTSSRCARHARSSEPLHEHATSPTSNRACLKPNSIRLSGRRQVRSWSQTCSELELGLSTNSLAAS